MMKKFKQIKVILPKDLEMINFSESSDLKCLNLQLMPVNVIIARS